MAYVENRVVHDADSHLMEMPDSLDAYFDLGDVRGFAEFLSDISRVVEPSTCSVRLSGAAEALHSETLASPLNNAETRNRACVALGSAQTERALAEGRLLTMRQAIDEAIKALGGGRHE